MPKKRNGFIRKHGDLVAHKGYYDRHGRYFLMPEALEDWIVEEICQGCLVSFYTLSLPELTEYLENWRLHHVTQ